MLRREIPHQVHEGRVLYLSRSRLAPALPADGDVLTPLHPWQPWTSDMQPLCYWQDEPVALQLAAKPGDEWIDGRQWMGELPSEWYALLSTALQVGAWLENHRFCGRCGAEATKLATEFAMHCHACGHRNYPRISPCIITLVTSGEAMLLARSPRFPPGRYSTLAGFIEPGETAEEAVHREIFEEVGVHVSQLRYYQSQAWPFPHSLMLGFFAEATTRRIRIDEVEISDAAWFSPRQLPALPPVYSISRELIETHLARWR
ncbi:MULTISPECIES: NAD(+) diphosphatase [unclassified Halomonas]|uniref:NAD(+) diphosphatase n=1 Tax=unclassified Halomonas TaxID=2609666 RepID=UPI0006DAB02C|nr:MULTISPECIES: NAD(+) diphosphatase [unclassified Halomonas]KPQ21131.1 MAG: NAD+ diphosphatase NudC [Halomonas sp. HL-93]SBR48683.1 NAD+ diphosphatase [Halomonas sp. HL-93]SNY96158.1 NAD+ diphosphatase [Halomonas sp. hl-4]